MKQVKYVYFNYYGYYGQAMSRVHLTKKEAIRAAKRHKEGGFFVFKIAVKYVRQ